MRLSEMARQVDGRLVGDDREITDFSSDTRDLTPGQMFIALSGANFDANDFVPVAVERGAAAVLVSRESPACPVPQLVVADTFRALGRLARAWREQFPGLVRVAITGSSGKTTTKEMLASIFRQAGPTLATLGNKNNEIGVPLTLLRLRPEHRYGVFELGANHRGEIAYTVGLVAPHASAIVNVGTAHLEGFGSRSGIAEAKGEIFSALGDTGVAVINADDDFAEYHAGLNADRRIVRFSTTQAADVRATDLRMEPGGVWSFMLHLAGETVPVRLGLLGRHNVANALAAAALASACGMSPEQIRAGLEQTRPPHGRLELHRAGGLAVIDDTYNANPSSMKAALDVLAACPGRRIAVLGDMGELGEGAADLHREVGAHARQAGIDVLLVVGNARDAYLDGFGDGEASAYPDHAALAADLPARIGGDATVLVKGSRSARMERVVQQLVEEAS